MERFRHFDDDWDYIDNKLHQRRKIEKQNQIRQERKVKRDHQFKELENDDRSLNSRQKR